MRSIQAPTRPYLVCVGLVIILLCVELDQRHVYDTRHHGDDKAVVNGGHHVVSVGNRQRWKTGGTRDGYKGRTNKVGSWQRKET